MNQVDMYHSSDQPQMYCPNCQMDLTLTKPEVGAVRPPKHGDQSVCFKCLTYLKYVEVEPGVLRLDVILRDEFDSLPEQLQIGLMRVRGELLGCQEQGQRVQPNRWEAALAVEFTKLKQRVAVLEAESCVCYYCSSGDGLNCIHRRKREALPGLRDQGANPERPGAEPGLA